MVTLERVRASVRGTAETPQFTCAVLRTGTGTYLQPAGELDMATAPIFGARIEVLLAAGVEDLVLDLRALTFLDCCALGVVLRHAGAFRALIPGRANVQRLFELTGTTRELPFLDAPEAIPAAEQLAARSA